MMGVSQGDWSLQRKGPADQARHEAKVREAILAHIEDIVTDTAIISGGKAVVRVPMRSLREYRFRFDDQRQPHVAQGDGKTRTGQVLGQAGAADGRAGGGTGAGQDAGGDVLEAEVALDTLEDLVFAGMELPRLRPLPDGQEQAYHLRPAQVRRVGPMSGLDLRRSLRANLRRHARDGLPRVGPWLDDDLRFRSWREESLPGTSAAVVLMRDVSGSMGEFKKAIVRSLCFWMVRFLRTRYDAVQVVFLTHHVDAREVKEHDFFHLAESGGTRVSSAYRLALDVAAQRFAPARWNLYVYHFSDGDNWGESDNRLCVDLVRQLMGRRAQVGYAEVAEGGYTSPLWTALADIQQEGFIAASIRERRDVYPALCRFFPRSDDGEAHR